MKTLSSQHGKIQVSLFPLLIILALAVLPISGLIFDVSASGPTPPAQATFTTQVQAEVSPTPLELIGPASAQVGDRVSFVLMGKNVKDVAGFQAVLNYDPAGLQFASARLSEKFYQSGGSIMSVGPVTKGGSVLLGAATCPIEGCKTGEYTEATHQTPRLSGDVPLAIYDFVVRSPSTFEIRMSNSELVDAPGQVLFSSNQSNQSGTTDVINLDALDTTVNRVINGSDAETLVGKWINQFEIGRCPGTNEDDCVDIADVQLILAHWGETTSGDKFVSPMTTLRPQATLTLTVNSNLDSHDFNPGDGICADADTDGKCTFRAAVEEANQHRGSENIVFNIRDDKGNCPSSVTTIEPGTTITIEDLHYEGSGVNIDGYTQCGASANTGAVVGNAVIKIEIKGPATADPVNGPYGLYIHSSNNVVKGLALYKWNHQIRINGGWANHNIIQGNFLGTDAANIQNSNIGADVDNADGVRLDFGGAVDNTIGGSNPADRNIISGANQDGVGIRGVLAHDNKIIGNYIGLKQDGLNSFPNSSDGVDIGAGANNNIVGGLNSPGERNVISRNSSDGVEIAHQTDTTGNVIQGNFIGLDATGTIEKRNAHKGITVEDGAGNNTFDHNVVAGNGTTGILFFNSSGNQVTKNFIGVLPQGIGPGVVVPDPLSVPEANLTAMPNGVRLDWTEVYEQSGIWVAGGSQHNLIQGNIVAYHPYYGIYVDAYQDISWSATSTCTTYFNTISDNRIYNNDRDGIFFRPDRCGTTDFFYPNEDIRPPVLQDASTATISGTACNNCTVELFLSDKTAVGGTEPAGEGKLLVGSGLANGSGSFSIPVNGLVVGDIVSGTSTDASGNTSMFAVNVAVHASEPTATPTATATNTATPTATPTKTATPTSTTTPNPQTSFYLPLVVR